MDIRQLEIFQKIVDEKSFSRAAKSLGLTQPTASGHIKSLEKELGVRLFDRLGREVEPTQAGWILLDYAQKILETREEAHHALEDYQGIIRGHMSVAASSIPGGYLLPRFLGAFMQEYPETSISIDILGSRKVIDGVLGGDFPIGITGAQIPHDQLSYRLFAGDELILAVPKGHPLAKRKRIKAKELAGQKMILREKGSGTRLVAEERLRAAGLEMNAVRVAAELGDPQAVRTALKAGVGISIVSRHAVEEDLVRGELKEVKIEGFNCARSFYSVVHKGRSLTPLCRSFLEFIHAEG